MNTTSIFLVSIKKQKQSEVTQTELKYACIYIWEEESIVNKENYELKKWAKVWSLEEHMNNSDLGLIWNFNQTIV